MTAIIHHETRHDHLALVFAERERRQMWRPSAFAFPASGTEARRAETRSGSVHDGPVPARQTPNLSSKDHPHV